MGKRVEQLKFMAYYTANLQVVQGELTETQHNKQDAEDERHKLYQITAGKKDVACDEYAAQQGQAITELRKCEAWGLCQSLE